MTPAPDSWDVVFDTGRRRTPARSPPMTAPSTSPTPRVYLMAHPARAGHHQPLRARRDAVRRRGRPAQGSSAASSAATGACTPTRSPRSSPATASLGTTWQVSANVLKDPPRPRRSRPSCPRRARPAGPTPGCCRPRSQHPNCVLHVHEPHHLARGEGRRSTEYFGEAPANTKACQSSTADTPYHCPVFHAEDEDYFSKVYFWATPQTRLPRWPDRRGVHRLRPLDPSLDGDQGLSPRPRSAPPRPGDPHGPRGTRAACP